MENNNNTPVIVRGKAKNLQSTELAYFFEQMYVFSKSGVAIWESLLILKQNIDTDHDSSLINQLYDLVSAGDSFSKAMYTAGGFPDYAIGMVEVGEETGKMEDVFGALNEYYKNRDKLAKSIRSSITYPLAMAAMVMVVIFVLLVQVMPVFQQVFSQLGLSLNSVSQALLTMGEQLNNYALYIVSVVVVIGVIILAMRLSSSGRQSLYKIYESIPLTRQLSRSENANRFAFAMSLMLGSSLDIISSLEFSMLITDSHYTKERIKKVLESIDKGESLSNALIDSGVFQAKYNGMIVAGMRSGTASEMLMSIANRYYEETEKQTQKLIGIIEPTMVAVLCLLVSMVMLSVMLPLTGMLSGM